MENLKHKHKEGVTVGYRDNNLVAIDSREVAEMMGKEHKEILQYIEGRVDKKGNSLVIGIVPTLESEGLHSQKYFIPSTYRSGTREYKCYLVTKMGCELLGNKQQGEKGILFTAKYVERFNQMEQAIKGQTFNTSRLSKELQAIFMLDQKTVEIDNRVTKLENTMTIDFGQQEVIQRVAKERLVEVLGGKDTPAYRELSKKVFSNLWKRYKQVFHVSSYKDTAKKDYEEAINYIEKWEPSKELGYMITGANSQIQFNN